jgi:diacylglycerol O-acyltransferase
MAVDALADRGAESLRTVRGAARLAAGMGNVRSSVRIADTLRRTALAVGEDVLRPAPSSYVNVEIGPRRTLVHHSASINTLLDARDEMPGAGRATLNDVALSVVAGALRELSMSAGRVPQPLKVMVPVSTRTQAEAAALGNKIAFVFIELPVHLHRPFERLAAVHEATARFKRERRASGGAALLGAIGVLPEPLKDAAAKLAASPRMYNLTVSNVQGPRDPVYLLGCELREAVPVIPLPERHALSIGIFTYGDRVTFSGYADPAALPGVNQLPGALNAAMLELEQLSRRNGRGRSHAAVA